MQGNSIDINVFFNGLLVKLPAIIDIFTSTTSDYIGVVEIVTLVAIMDPPVY